MRALLIAALVLILASPAFAQKKPLSQVLPGPQSGLIHEGLKAIEAQKQPPVFAGTDDSNVYQALAAPLKQLADFVGGNVDDAITLSTQIPELQDGNGQQCWAALKTFGKVMKAHPVPLTFRIASDIEGLRLATMAANKLCAKKECTQVFADLATSAQAATTALAINVKIPVMSLHDICAAFPLVDVQAPDPSLIKAGAVAPGGAADAPVTVAPATSAPTPSPLAPAAPTAQ